MANIEIGGRLHSTATGNVVTGANEVLDDTKNKKQSVINAEVDETIGDDNTAGTIKGRIKTAEGKLDTLNGDSSTSGSVAKSVDDAKTELIGGATSDGNTLKKVEDRTATLETAVGSNGSVDQRIAAAKSEVIGDAASDYNTLGKLEDKIQAEATRATTRENQIYDLVHTPEQHYVTVATYAELANIASPSDDTVYRVSSYNGKTSQVDNTVYSEYGYDGTNFVFLCVKSQIDEVYDISAHHSNNTYVDLAAALDGGNNIPQELRRGGMSVKFVQSSDNKYVQYRLITTSFSINEYDWQGITNELDGSLNFVTASVIGNGNIVERIQPANFINLVINTNNVVGVPASSTTQRGIIKKVLKGHTYSFIPAIKVGVFNVFPEIGTQAVSIVNRGYFSPNEDCYVFLNVSPEQGQVSIWDFVNGIFSNIEDIKNEIGTLNTSTVVYPNSGLVWANSQLNYSTTSWDAVLVKLEKGVTYNSVSNGTKQIYRGFPTPGEQPVYSSVSFPFTPDEENLYLLSTVNTKNVQSVILSHTPTGIFGRVDRLPDSLSPLDTLFSDSTIKSLSANQGKILNEKIEGASQAQEVSLVNDLIPNKYYDMRSFFNTEGATTYFPPSSPSGAYDNCYCLKREVHAGETYVFYSGDKKNYTSRIGHYILTNSEGLVISYSMGASEVVTLDIVEDGTLTINFIKYDSSRDYISATIIIKISEGIKGELQNLNNEIQELSNTFLKGKKIVCFGDSLTEFKDIYGKSYSEYLADEYGVIAFNCGIGGSKFLQRTTPSINPQKSNVAYAGLDVINMVRAACGISFDQEYTYLDVARNSAAALVTLASDDNTAIIETLASINWSEIQAVTFFAGTNDWTSSSDMFGESGSYDPTYTRGAINEIIRLILTTYPHLKIYWFTPTLRVIVPKFSVDTQYHIDDVCQYSNLYYKFTQEHTGEWDASKVVEITAFEARKPEYFSDVVEKSGMTLKQYSKLIEEEVENQHIPVCDMYNTLGVNRYNFSNFFEDRDGTHPRRGNVFIARKIASFLIANKTF